MIPLFRVNMSEEAVQNTIATLRSGYVAEGDRVKEFEAQLTEYLGAPVLTLNSCTSALDLALHLCNVGPGDEVITTPVTCTATNGVIVRRGAIPVWVDVDPLSGNIYPPDVAKKRTSKTKAIMAVDWSGHPCFYAQLRDIADGIPIIEDAAHAFGATYKNKPIAQSGGDYVCWSFQAIKHLTCGDGGAIKVPAEQYRQARLLRWYGLDRESSVSFRCKQNIREVGYKYHMNDVAAAIGLGNLAHAKASVELQRANAAYYHEHLPGFGSGVERPTPNPESAWWLYCIRLPNRDEFIEFAKRRGVETSPVHARTDKHTAFNFPNGILPGVTAFTTYEVAIPVGWWMSCENLDYVIQIVKDWISK